MSQQEKQEITNPEVIQEYQTAVTGYVSACEKTLEQERVILHVRKQTSALVLNVPKHGGDIENWSIGAAEELACQLDVAASAHSEQAERLHEQAAALRRMNKAVKTVVKEVKDNEASASAEG
jgi:cobalamin biosynthesis protein CobT